MFFVLRLSEYPYLFTQETFELPDKPIPIVPHDEMKPLGGVF